MPRADGLLGVGGGFLVHAWANADESPALRQILADRREAFRNLTRSIVQSAIARRQVPADVDADGLAGAISSMLDGLLLQRAEKGEAFGREDARRQAFALVGAILRPGPSPVPVAAPSS